MIMIVMIMTIITIRSAQWRHARAVRWSRGDLLVCRNVAINNMNQLCILDIFLPKII